MDPYKSLLASASREHMARAPALQSALVGNVLLPAIRSPSRRADAPLAAQHLKVIEQCIAAENRREAQLAKCQSALERRRWERKFQAQRRHERALIEALMIPPARVQGLELELELLDLDARSECKRDGLGGGGGLGGGLSSSVASPDRVFHKAAASSTLATTRTARPHVRAKFSLPECQGSPGKKPRRERGDQPSPPTRKRSPSRSASPVRSAAMGSVSKSEASPPRAQAAGGVGGSRTARVVSKTRVPPLKSLPKPPMPARKRDGDRDPSLVASRRQTDAKRSDSVTLLDGAWSYAEAKRLVLAVTASTGDTEAKETQTSSRGEQKETQTSSRGEQKETQTSGRTETTNATHRTLPAADNRSLIPGGEGLRIGWGEERDEKRRARPYSSPPPRLLSLGSASRAENGHVHPSTDVIALSNASVETAAPGESEGSSVEVKAEIDDAGSGISGGESSADAAEEEELVPAEESSPLAPKEDGGMADDAPLASQADEEELELDVAEVLFDLVDFVADAVERELEQQQLDTSVASSGLTELRGEDAPSNSESAQAAAVTAAIGPLTSFQALFRGHSSRRAFRRALYEESLRCGMLGAMPGTTQGASGWYQDPKSLIAYYFVVDASTGEWAQQHALRCRRLVLTPFEMRAELSTAYEMPGATD